MAKYKLLNTEEKAVIFALKGEGLSIRTITLRIKRNASTVSRFLKQYTETTGGQTRRRGGRQRKTTARDERVLQRLCLKNRASTSTELAKELKDATGVSVSASTVRRRLKSMKLQARRPRKKPILSTKMRRARLL
ncbi:Transposase [Popillia japonica]|uniref:Transposase n=1 Tax=Popillia japonica TaxID=7064 RepID=A0AAW1KMN6_POPJA